MDYVIVLNRTEPYWTVNRNVTTSESIKYPLLRLRKHFSVLERLKWNRLESIRMDAVVQRLEDVPESNIE